MTFHSFFRRRTSRPAPPPPLAAQPLPYTRLTLADWRASPERVAFVGGLLRQPLFLDLLGMLSNLRPPTSGDVASGTAARLLGQREGHDQIIASLLAAAIPPPSLPATLAADYGASAVISEWEREGEGER